MIFTGFLPQQWVYFVVARAITRTSTESSWRMMQYALVMFSPAVPGWLLLHWRSSEIKKWDPKSVADFGFPRVCLCLSYLGHSAQRLHCNILG